MTEPPQGSFGETSGHNSRVRGRDHRKNRKRLTKLQLRLIDEHLDMTRGHRCAMEDHQCKGRLVRDHINDDPNDNRLANFQWLCRRHNRTKTRSLASKRVSEREIAGAAEGAVDAGDNLRPLSERMQADLEEWLWRRLGPDGPLKFLPVRVVKKEASYDCDMSPVTVDRYLVNPGPMTASKANWRLARRKLPYPTKRREKTALYIVWRSREILPEDGVVEWLS